MRYAVVMTSGEVDIRETDELQTKDVMDIVGGDLDQMPSHPDIAVFAFNGSSEPYNWSATRLCSQYLMPNDHVCGPAVVTGAPNRLGDPTDVPQNIIDLLSEWYAHRK